MLPLAAGIYSRRTLRITYTLQVEEIVMEKYLTLSWRSKGRGP